MKNTSSIHGFHAHVYFDAQSHPQAETLCHDATENFDLKMGRIHKKLVGPHPCWSCQLAFAPEVFADLVPWLALNRNGLVILVHPESGDELADHRDHALWMGAVETLDLSMFESGKD